MSRPRKNIYQKNKNHQSRLIPVYAKHRTYLKNRNPFLSQQSLKVKQDPLSGIYNKNIHQFRQTLFMNDPTHVPFMSALRNYARSKLKGNQKTITQPFDVAFKTTCNQTIRKRISDLQGGSQKLSTIYHSWHHKTGLSVRQNAEFGCSLRAYSCHTPLSIYNPPITPIRYEDVEEHIYNPKQLVCQRKANIFRTK